MPEYRECPGGTSVPVVARYWQPRSYCPTPRRDFVARHVVMTEAKCLNRFLEPASVHGDAQVKHVFLPRMPVHV